MKQRNVSGAFPFLLAGLCVLLLSAGPATVIASGIESGTELRAPFREAPANPEFLRQIRDREAGRPGLLITEEGYRLGLLAPPVDLSHMKSYRLPVEPARLPVKYDLRTKNKLTPVKDQGGAGTCWAFATYGSLESYFKPGAAWDFSERNLAEHHGFDLGLDDGGHLWMSAAYLARWAGPLGEADDPYVYYSPDRAAAPKKHVQNILFMPTRRSSTDNAAIKSAVMAYGAVSVSMAWAPASWNAATHSYYYSGATWVGGHAVCVVGWDDGYPKTKFKKRPPGNGAFIVRNSWGKGFGDKGYFYVSYYDRQFARENANAVVKGESPRNYRANYGYDELGWAANIGAVDSTTCWMANVFKAAATGFVKAAGFYTAAASNAYDISIYTNVSAGDPTSGKKYALSKKGTIKGMGYFTVPLGFTVPVTKGRRFSIVVKLTSAGYAYPICIEKRIGGYSSRARALAGESFIAATGTLWLEPRSVNPAWTNVCLRAYTKS